MKGHFLRINKGFFKDTMRLYLVSAIVFSVISALSSFFMGYSMCSHDAAAMNFHIDTDIIQVLVCIFMTYLGASLARKLTDMNVAEVYASIPVSRDSIWTAHLLTGIIYSLMIMAASTIAMFLGELTGAISVGQSIGSYGYSAFEYMAGLCVIMLEGLLDFAFIGVAFSITGKVFAGIVTAGIGSFGIGILILGLFSTGSIHSVCNIIFPFSAAARTAAVWIVCIVAVILFLLLFRKMFLTIRTESYSHAFRNKRIQTIVGLMLAFSILCTIAFTIADIEASGEIMNYRNDIVRAAIGTIVTCLIVYFIFMWISGRSFKKAAISLKYLPISLLAVCIVVLLGSGVRKAYRNVDFSADNIAYYTIPNYYVPEEQDWYDNSIEINLFPMLYTDYSQDRYGKGVYGEDEIRFTDQKTIKEISKYLRLGNNSAISSFPNNGEPSIYVTLKNGKTYAVRRSMNVDFYNNVEYKNNARQNEEYRKVMHDIERFKDGHFVLENKRVNALYDTFMEELSALSIEEREKLFDLSSIYNIGTPMVAEIAAPDTVSGDDYVDVPKEIEFTPYARVLFIANRSNSLIRGIILNESTPKTLEAYLKLSNELNSKDEKFDKALKFLEDEDMGVNMQFEFVIWDKVTQESHKYYIESYTDNAWGFERYELSNYERELMDEYLMNSFNVSIDELTEEQIQMVYYTMDFTSGLNYYEQVGMDEDGLTDEMRREDLIKLIGIGDEGNSQEQYHSDVRKVLAGFLHGDKDFDSSRYVVTIVSMDVTSLNESDEFMYEYVESVMMDAASNFFDYPMSFGISEEVYNGFIHGFNEKYDDVYFGEPMHNRG